jgi:CHASE1-domain containing sensor protein
MYIYIYIYNMYTYHSRRHSLSRRVKPQTTKVEKKVDVMTSTLDAVSKRLHSQASEDHERGSRHGQVRD